MKTISAFSLVVLLAGAWTAYGDRNWEEEEEHSKGEHHSAEEIVAFAREHAPEALERLKRAKREGEESYHETLERYGDFLEEYHHLREEHPEAADRFLEAARLELRSELLAERFHDQEDEEDRRETRRELQEVLERAFHLRLEQLDREVESLEAELDHMSRMLKKRREARDRIIERRINDLLGVNEYLEWW
jgi:hypothetical protein